MIFGFVLGLTPVVNNPLFAQQNIFIKKKYFTMPPRVKSTDYYHGMIQVKLKPEFRSALSGSQREISKRLKILETMQISSVQQAVPKGIKDYSNARYDKPFKFDPGLITTRSSSSSKVVMYSTQRCGYCKQARRYFTTC